MQPMSMPAAPRGFSACGAMFAQGVTHGRRECGAPALPAARRLEFRVFETGLPTIVTFATESILSRRTATQRTPGWTGRLMVAAIVGLVQAPAVAIEDVTAGELALTPPFCQDVQQIPLTNWSKTRPSPRAPTWVSVMGETFWAMHHYCWALIGLHRADRAGTPPNVRAWRIKDAIDDFYFVVRNAPPDFVLLPELHFRLGEAFVQLGDYGSALIEYSKSRTAKPDYWPAYVGESNVLAKARRTAEAQDLLKEGLRLMPGEPNLASALEALSRAPGRVTTERKQ